jgi:Major Facilitator Superfamily
MSDHTELRRQSLSTRTVRAVIWNQLLWTAGYSLTTGGFLLYFAKDLNATHLQIALILVIPETFGFFGLYSRRFINLFQSRKKTWLYLSLFSRLISLGIPIAAIPFISEQFDSLYSLFIPAMIFSSILNSLAYMAYLSWLSDLAPEEKWGTFFAKRNIAKLSILLVLPVIAGFGRDWLRNQEMPTETLWIYVAVFCIGTLLQLGSIIPMLSLKDVMRKQENILKGNSNQKYKGHFLQALNNRSLRYLVIHNWWLAFFNGLTQSVFFLFLFTKLHVGLGIYYLLVSTMQLIKIPVSKVTGQWCDRNQEKRVMLVSLFIASSGLIFWIMASENNWFYLFGAYACWGAYAALNISGRNLLFKLSPRSDNSFELSLFRQVSGFFAGISGLLGGFWLTNLVETEFSVLLGNYEVGPYQFLFLISLIGRYLSSLWLIPVRQPPQISAS